MREQPSYPQQYQNQQPQQYQIRDNTIQKRVEHPPQNYTFHQIYSIRKQSMNYSNQLLYKKLNKSFNRIKRLRSESSNLNKQFDFQNDPIRQSYKKLREIYNSSTKTNLIVKKKIDKMRNRVDKIKAKVENSELFMISQVDLSKIYTCRSTNPQMTSQNSQNANSVSNSGTFNSKDKQK